MSLESLDLEVVDTPFGKFQVDPRDIIGSTTKAGTLWDGPGFLQPIAIEHGQLGQEGMTILDVGAHIGTFSVWLARHGAWRVVAVEPVPPTMRQLKANLDLNREVTADVVIPVEVAGYDRRCVMELAAPLDPGNSGGTALIEDQHGSLQGAPLDVFSFLFGQRVSLVKVDAQGCDFAVLKGLQATLERDRPVVVFEWEAELAQAHGHSLAEALAWLSVEGYQVEAWPCYANNYLGRPR